MSDTDGVPALGAEALRGLEVAEERDGFSLRLRSWERRDPDLVCGITTAEAGDFGVFGAPADDLYDSFAGLAGDLRFSEVSVPLLVHGHDVVEIIAAEPDDRPLSLDLRGRLDGQVTGARGCLLVATAADCVPVYLWRPAAGAVGLLHAGWRGIAAGILSKGLRSMPGAPSALQLHLGPAICGQCYEVDGPVLDALGLEGDRARVDLRGLLVLQALEAGVSPGSISTSAHCTSCGTESLHSHRGSGGSAGRMAAFIGLRRPA